MKRQVYYRLAKARRWLRNWANTPRGEKIIVRTLTTITIVGIIDAALLVIGCMMEK